jgi:hypothetical protein
VLSKVQLTLVEGKNRDNMMAFMQIFCSCTRSQIQRLSVSHYQAKKICFIADNPKINAL